MKELFLDEYCKKILAVLLLMREDYRFNELFRFLNRNGVKVSKPTLSEHLKHLCHQDILIRQEEGIQKVIYRVNFNRFRKLDEASNISQEIVTRFYQQEKHFKSLPLDRKIDYYNSLTVLQSLLLFKLDLLEIAKPDKQFEYSLASYSTLQHFGTIKNWLLDDFRKNPELIDQATKELEDLLARYPLSETRVHTCRRVFARFLHARAHVLYG